MKHYDGVVIDYSLMDSGTISIIEKSTNITIKLNRDDDNQWYVSLSWKGLRGYDYVNTYTGLLNIALDVLKDLSLKSLKENS